MPRDSEKALFWYEKAAYHGNLCAMYNAAGTLLQVAMENSGSFEISGRSHIPRTVIWAAKAAAASYEGVRKFLYQFKRMAEVCFRCGNRDVVISKCSKYKCIYNCRRECQKLHWSNDQKTDSCAT